MNRNSFETTINNIKNKNRLLFTLESDATVDYKTINEVERYYGVDLPHSYKEFLRLNGGGYFGYIVVYSCDNRSDFYIKHNVSKKWVEEEAFIPIIDLETGDYLGFKVKNGICNENITLYTHDDGKCSEMQIDFYEALLKFGMKYELK